MPARDELQAMAFGVVLFTLLAQGTTIQSLLKRLGLTEKSPQRLAREAQQGRLFARRAGLRRLEKLHHEGLLPDEMWYGLRHGYLHDHEQVLDEMKHLFRVHAELEGEMLLEARREALRAERGALWDALRRGVLSDEVCEELSTDIDHRLEAIGLMQSRASAQQEAGEES
jgi:CPA1 family monovalent cation:H+ antiporter